MGTSLSMGPSLHLLPPLFSFSWAPSPAASAASSVPHPVPSKGLQLPWASRAEGWHGLWAEWGGLVGDRAVAAAEQGLQPRAPRWPCKGSHLLSSQRSHDVFATGFSIMELLGGQVGVTRTPSRDHAEVGALGFCPWQRRNHSLAMAPLSEPGSGVTMGLGRGVWGTARACAGLRGRGHPHAGLMGTRRSRSQTGSFSLCLGTRCWLETAHHNIRGLARLTWG